VIDPAAVGFTAPPFEVALERGKIIEFARAVGAAHPDHLAPDAVIPGTFLITRLFWQQLVAGADAWPHVGADPARSMHAEHEYVFHGPPPRAGQALTAQARIESIEERFGRRGSRTWIVLVTDFRDDAGALVAEERMTMVQL
jgi:hydroxyacyl-ACP dehydratase HTD2-like protein with hotdog domain